MMVFLNGKWASDKKASISIFDHGFLYGDGVYETIRVYHGKPFLLGEHLRRLNNSMLGIHLSPPLSLMQTGMAIQKTIELNKHKDAVVRVIITRGPGEHGFNPTLCPKPTVLITSSPVQPYSADLYKKGATLAVVGIRRHSPQSQPPSIKSTSCLNGILAKIESLDVEADEALMLNEHKNLTEGCVSNIFLVKKNEIWTPRLEDGVLPGVTRQWVCSLAHLGNYSLYEKKLTVTDLASADEVFLTSTIMEILPVSKIILTMDSQKKQIRVGPHPKSSGWVGPVTLDLRRRFKDSLQRFSQV